MAFLIKNLRYSRIANKIACMVLKPQDIVILLKIIAIKGDEWSYSSLARDLSMSASEVHAGVKRAEKARLIDLGKRLPIKSAIEEFLIYGVKYAFPPTVGGLVRGMPTGYAAPPLLDIIVQPNEPPPVWPFVDGTVKGQEFSPLYKNVPIAASRDNSLYELLALVDAIRGGRSREKKLAINEIKSKIGSS
jgi:hypothetical protein